MEIKLYNLTEYNYLIKLYKFVDIVLIIILEKINGRALAIERSQLLMKLMGKNDSCKTSPRKIMIIKL